MKKGFNKKYFENYGWDGDDKSYEATLRISDVIFNPAIRIYKRTHNNSVPSTYVETGCGNGYYINKMLSYGTEKCIGCDFSDYFDGNIVCPKDFFYKKDAITFLKEDVNFNIDLCYDGTIQYLSDSDLDTLLTLLYAKINKNGVLAIAYDEDDDVHPYRKQKHSVKEWKEIMKKYKFSPTKCQYVFIKK